MSPRLLTLLLLLPVIALARVGGGESYSSGDDSGDGGGLPLELIFLLVELLFRHPQIGVPVLIVVGIVWVSKNRKRNSDAGRREREHARAEQRTRGLEGRVDGWVATLKQADPAFELAPLLARARTLVARANEAWFLRELAPLRPFLSDATWQRLRTQLELLRSQGVRDAIADLRVLEVSPIGLEKNPWYDTLHLRVEAELRDTEVPADLGDDEARARARAAPLERFTEVWSFVRKPGAQTRIGVDLFQGKCPQCGAPFRGGATNACEYCGAIANSGNYDWSLAHITQGSEFLPRTDRIPGLEALRGADPAFSLNLLEDRTALVFWRWVEARASRSTTPLAKLAAPELLTSLADELQADDSASALRDVALGAAHLTKLEVDPDGEDRAHLELRWSARTARSGPPLPQRWRFVLARRHGVLTPQGNGVSSSRCHHCHAPLTDSASAHCDFCGTQLTAGGDWVLREATPI